MKPYYKTRHGCLYQGNALSVLRELPDASVQTCITSPPYWGLRDYNVEGQLGLEPTPELYVKHMVEIFREVRRVLRDDGTLWLNLGDSYASGKGSCFNPGGGDNSLEGHATLKEAGAYKLHRGNKSDLKKSGLKPKDLIGIPWRVGFALQADGWYLRSDIIWSKPNPMPESVTDRPTKAHEYIFLMSKGQRYWYDGDAITEPQEAYERDRRLREMAAGLNTRYTVASEGKTGQAPQSEGGSVKNLQKRHELAVDGTRNKRTVWTVATHPFPEAHFATFPPKLIEPCVLAGSPKGGTVLDPFFGSGTTGIVAYRHDRQFIGIELSAEYCEMAVNRIDQETRQLKLWG